MNWLKRYERQLLDRGIEAEFIFVSDELVTIEVIGMRKEQQGKGIGSEIMKTLTTFADKFGITLQLRPSASSTHSRTKLIQFYKKFGFVENKEENIHSLYQYMYRLKK